jgi:hypothetical protein
MPSRYVKSHKLCVNHTLLIATVESPQRRLLEDEKNKYYEHACNKLLNQTRTNNLATSMFAAQALRLMASSSPWFREKVHVFLDLGKIKVCLRYRCALLRKMTYQTLRKECCCYGNNLA